MIGHKGGAGDEKAEELAKLAAGELSGIPRVRRPVREKMSPSYSAR